MKNPSISVIIPNYNGKKLLQNNLPSVFAALQQSGLTFELIIVDDCSNDDSVTFIQQNYPQIVLVKKPTNTGFSAACNAGIRQAQYAYIMLLNSDIQLSPNYFEGQMDYFKHKDTFGVMAKIIGAKKGELQDTARFYSHSWFKIKPNRFFHVSNPTVPIPTAYLSGANALIDAEKLKAIGGFNEIFSPFYYEDFDLGIRAWKMGWKCYYHPDTYCLHDHSATTRNYRTKNWVKSIYFRNRFMIHALHLSPLNRLMWYMQLFINSLLMWLTGKFYFYKAIYLFLGKFAEIKQSRKTLKNLMEKQGSKRTISDIQQEMKNMLSGQKIVDGLG